MRERIGALRRWTALDAPSGAAGRRPLMRERIGAPCRWAALDAQSGAAVVRPAPRSGAPGAR